MRADGVMNKGKRHRGQKNGEKRQEEEKVNKKFCQKQMERQHQAIKSLCDIEFEIQREKRNKNHFLP